MTENRSEVVRREGGMTAPGYRISFCSNENVLKLDYAYYYTTLTTLRNPELYISYSFILMVCALKHNEAALRKEVYLLKRFKNKLACS